MALRRIKARSLGRLELLQWLNEFLEDDYSKIEHLADGVAFCQIFDALFPGAVPLHKLNFHTKGEADYVKNLRAAKLQFSLQTHACRHRSTLVNSNL